MGAIRHERLWELLIFFLKKKINIYVFNENLSSWKKFITFQMCCGKVLFVKPVQPLIYSFGLQFIQSPSNKWHNEIHINSTFHVHQAVCTLIFQSCPHNSQVTAVWAVQGSCVYGRENVSQIVLLSCRTGCFHLNYSNKMKGAFCCCCWRCPREQFLGKSLKCEKISSLNTFWGKKNRQQHTQIWCRTSGKQKKNAESRGTLAISETIMTKGFVIAGKA